MGQYGTDTYGLFRKAVWSEWSSENLDWFRLLPAFVLFCLGRRKKNVQPDDIHRDRFNSEPRAYRYSIREKENVECGAAEVAQDDTEHDAICNQGRNYVNHW